MKKESNRSLICRGSIVYAKDREELTVFENSCLVVEDGKVEGIYPEIPERFAGLPVDDFGKGVIIPAFSDLHVHAPQYPQRGLGMDLLLSDWLDQYTFALEARYADPDFAHAVYGAFVDDMVANGTMHACIYGTIHREATAWLLEKLEEKGIDAYVGKVNMDTASPAYLIETPEESLAETEAFLEAYARNRYAKPLLTPRFAPTCSPELIRGLGRLGKKYGVGMQTHVVESKWEAAQALVCFPDCTSDSAIYEQAGLLDNGPVIFAHFIFPTREDIRILKSCGGYAVTCPDATVNVIAGIMRTAYLAGQGVRIGMGSDIAGGHHIGVYTQAARAVQLSKLKAFYEPEGNRALRFCEAFYMATKAGGAVFGKTGSFEPGYSFDALVIDGLEDSFREITPAQVAERFCYMGSKENIRARYLRGQKI